MSNSKKTPVRPHSPPASRMVSQLAWGASFISGSLPPALNMVRASSGGRFGATAAYATVGNDLPRIDLEPFHQTVRGLLVESQRTNLLLHSGDVGNVAWAKFQCSIGGSGAVKAPDGVTDVFPVGINAATSIHFPNRAVAIAAGSVVTFSVYLKKGACDKAMLSVDS